MRLSLYAPDDLTGVAGVYVLYDDGEDMHLLYTLSEQEVSEATKYAQEQLRVYKTGDGVMKVARDATVNDY